jgi:signal transduction histidine kinase
MSASSKPTLNLTAMTVDPLSPGRSGGRVNFRREERFASPLITLRNGNESAIATSTGGNVIGNTLRAARRVFEESRAVLQGCRIQGFDPGSIEHELSCFVENLPAAGVHCEVSAAGRRREFTRPIQEQVGLIAREALGHAFRHSGASHIEAEIEYSTRRFRLIVRDNGRGIASAKASNDRDLQWSLRNIRVLAENIGAQLTIWSRPGAGTEVEVSLPCHFSADACA